MSVYLVTGGAGFIGSHLCDLLLAGGSEIRVLDDLSTGRRENLADGIRLIEGDIRDSQAVREAMRGVDGCFHLAAMASVQRSCESPGLSAAVNCLGAAVVFEAATAAGVPVVYASSAAVYGDGGRHALAEDAPSWPLSPYAADKIANELYARTLGFARRLRSFGLRFFNVYGSRQDPSSPYSGVISIFLQRARAGEDLMIFGDGAQTRDFVHVGDVVRFLAAAMAKADVTAPVANVCTGQPSTVRKLAEHIVSTHGGRIVHGPPRMGDIAYSLGSPHQAQRLLGVTADTPLREGLSAL